MKKLTITLLATLMAITLNLKAETHTETGKGYTSDGRTFSITYVIVDDQYTEVYLLPPTGEYIKVSIQPGTTVETIDRTLAKLIETL